MSETPTFDPLEQARMDADVGKQIYDEMMSPLDGAEETPEQRAQAAQDMVDYLESRPYKEEDARRITDPDTGEKRNKDNYFDEKREEHYESTMPKAHDEKSITELTRDWANAEDNDDKTVIEELKATLEDKVITKEKMTDEEKQEALNLIEKRKDAMRSGGTKSKEPDAPSGSGVQEQSAEEIKAQVEENVEASQSVRGAREENSGKTNEERNKEYLDEQTHALQEAFDEIKAAQEADNADDYEKGLNKARSIIAKIEKATSKTLEEYWPGVHEEIRNQLGNNDLDLEDEVGPVDDDILPEEDTEKGRVRRAFSRATAWLYGTAGTAGSQINEFFTKEVDEETGERKVRKGRVVGAVGAAAVAIAGGYFAAKGLGLGGGESSHVPKGANSNVYNQLIDSGLGEKAASKIARLNPEQLHNFGEFVSHPKAAQRMMEWGNDYISNHPGATPVDAGHAFEEAMRRLQEAKEAGVVV